MKHKENDEEIERTEADKEGENSQQTKQTELSRSMFEHRQTHRMYNTVRVRADCVWRAC